MASQADPFFHSRPLPCRPDPAAVAPEPSAVTPLLGTPRHSGGECSADISIDSTVYISSESDVAEYLRSLFPFTRWIWRYNTQWLVGDVIGGLTLGFVVVPQAMAYALLAHLSPQYGLYTSLAGASLYWLFGTAKDVAIGATAVVSLLVGQVVSRVEDEHPGAFAPEDIAKTLAMLAGTCLLAFGMLRLDWIVELVPHIAIAAFVTSAAVTISLSQVPNMLGISGVDTHAPAVEVFARVVARLDECTLDAAVGITTLVFLQLVKSYCARMVAQSKQPHQQRAWDTLSSIRMSLAVLISTTFSFLLHSPLAPTTPSYFRILGPIPNGLTALGPPSVSPTLIRALLPSLPAVLVVLVVEHIAIGKAFARQNNYTISASQECVASGAANLLGPLVGAYSATGSFTGTAVLSKAGVRTPLAGVFNAMVLLAAAYACAGVFYYIPMASLAALIVHAVGNLVVRWGTLEKWWMVQKLDVGVFVIGVMWSLGVALEEGIYVTVGLSLVTLLMRMARAKGKFGDGMSADTSSLLQDRLARSDEGGFAASLDVRKADASLLRGRSQASSRGFVTYTFPSLNYLNQAQQMEAISAHVRTQTRRSTLSAHSSAGDIPWNEDPTAVHGASQEALPTLRTVILDLAAVEILDVSSWDGLVELRAQLDRWAAPDVVEWQFVRASEAARRALMVGGFNVAVDDVSSTLQPSAHGEAVGRDLDFGKALLVDSALEFGPKSCIHHIDRRSSPGAFLGSVSSVTLAGSMPGPASPEVVVTSTSMGSSPGSNDSFHSLEMPLQSRGYGTVS